MNNDNIIPLASLFESDKINDDDLEMIEIEDEPSIDNMEIIDLESIIDQNLPLKEIPQKRDYDKMIEKIQIGLIIFLIIIGTLIYFFGYDLFEPYIKID